MVAPGTTRQQADQVPRRRARPGHHEGHRPERPGRGPRVPRQIAGQAPQRQGGPRDGRALSLRRGRHDREVGGRRGLEVRPRHAEPATGLGEPRRQRGSLGEPSAVRHLHQRGRQSARGSGDGGADRQPRVPVEDRRRRRGDHRAGVVRLRRQDDRRGPHPDQARPAGPRLGRPGGDRRRQALRPVPGQGRQAHREGRWQGRARRCRSTPRPSTARRPSSPPT